MLQGQGRGRETPSCQGLAHRSISGPVFFITTSNNVAPDGTRYPNCIAHLGRELQMNLPSLFMLPLLLASRAVGDFSFYA